VAYVKTMPKLEFAILGKINVVFWHGFSLARSTIWQEIFVALNFHG